MQVHGKMKMPLFAFWIRVGVFCLAQVVTMSQRKLPESVREGAVLLTCTHILVMSAAYVVIHLCMYIMTSVSLRNPYLQVEKAGEADDCSTSQHASARVMCVEDIAVSFAGHTQLLYHIVYVHLLGFVMWCTVFAINFHLITFVVSFAVGLFIAEVYKNLATCQCTRIFCYGLCSFLCIAVQIISAVWKSSAAPDSAAAWVVQDTGPASQLQLFAHIVCFTTGFMWPFFLRSSTIYTDIQACTVTCVLICFPFLVAESHEMKMLLTTHADVLSIVLFMCEPLCKFLCIYILVVLLVRQSPLCEIQILLLAACLTGSRFGELQAAVISASVCISVLYSVLLCLEHRPDASADISLHSMSSIDSTECRQAEEGENALADEA